MKFESLEKFAKSLRGRKISGPVACVFAEDNFGLAETIVHLDHLGFTWIVVFGDNMISANVPANANLITVLCDFLTKATPHEIVNKIILLFPDQWIHVCFNAEFLIFPFCETRTIADASDFATDEKRKSVFGCTLDLYSDVPLTPQAKFPADNAFYDKVGYYFVAGSTVEPSAARGQIFGGLRWRLSEFVPENRRDLGRICLFRARPELQVDELLLFNDPQYESISSPWHHNMTMAVASFRAAKALAINPSSRSAANSLMWQMSEKFAWSSRQLLGAGFIEPGQWF